MKSPKGFGKEYFTKEDIDKDDPPLESLTLCEINNKPCRCNSYYKLKTILMLKINHFIPRCLYYTTCFAFRRSGIHPPYFIQ
ncbi:MAG: hypothetical protein QM497_07835 [Sulfurimonas sp.]